MTKEAVDWWNVEPVRTEEGVPGPEEPTHASAPHHTPTPEYVAPEPVREETEEETSGRARSMALKVVGAVGGVAIVGALMLNATSGNDEDAPMAAPSTASAMQPEELPPAGGGVSEGDLPAAGGAPQAKAEETPLQEDRAPSGIAITATPSGKGRVGAVMDIVIRNSADKPLLVMATLVQGDGRAGVVGEGTLAPGSRTVEPGQTVKGTIEFSSATAPHQVALVDLSGNIVAVADVS